MSDFTTRFKNIETIPLPYRNIFSNFPCFNIVQSEVLDDILYTDNSLVVSAPTGSGKTVIFELAIVRLLHKYENGERNKFKVIYICPIKSLCQERLQDWYHKFSQFDLKCTAITGDTDMLNFQSLHSHDIIISTPEKWDSLTRKWKDNKEIANMLKIVMIDEVHLLNEEIRGSTLEVIICRMKAVCQNTFGNGNIRFVAVSASIPNAEDIAEWIGRDNTKVYKFPEELRPVPLKKIILGYNYNPKTMPMFKFDLSLNYKLKKLIIQYSEGKPTLIFCSSRKSVEMTAQHLVNALQILLTIEQKQNLEIIASRIDDSKVNDSIKRGIGYHHAGLSPVTRHSIEEAFRDGHLPILVSTSTLAMGLNLPSHLVIIKSTKTYMNCEYRDYTDIAIQQMIGRAGRPQFDTSATALILTTEADKPKFEKMIENKTPIESNLHRHLTEHLNAEIVLGTITSLDVAMDWLASTFLYVRARKNPFHYGLKVELTEEKLDKKLLEMCQIDLNKLVKAGMITMDENIVIRYTQVGQIMANYYVAFETMKLFTQLSGEEILMQILSLVSKCQEFCDIRLRMNDKKTLNALNNKVDGIRFPLNGKIKTGSMKVNCLIQAVLGNLEVGDHSLTNESMTIIRNGERIVKCLIKYLSTRKTNYYNALKSATLLGKCFHAKLWENSIFVCKQLNGIGNVFSTQLANAGKTSFSKILMSNPRDIEMIVKKKPPFGDHLIEEVKHIPRYSMSLENFREYDDHHTIKLSIELSNLEDIKQKSTLKLESQMILLVGNDENEILLYEKYKQSSLLQRPSLTRVLDIRKDSAGSIEAHFISENWVGIDCSCKLSVEREQNHCIAGPPDEVRNQEGDYMKIFLDMYKKVKPQKKDTSENQNMEKKTKAPKTPAKQNTKNMENTMKVPKTPTKKSATQKNTLLTMVEKMTEKNNKPVKEVLTKNIQIQRNIFSNCSEKNESVKEVTPQKQSEKDIVEKVDTKNYTAKEKSSDMTVNGDLLSFSWNMEINDDELQSLIGSNFQNGEVNKQKVDNLGEFITGESTLLDEDLSPFSRSPTEQSPKETNMENKNKDINDEVPSLASSYNDQENENIRKLFRNEDPLLHSLRQKYTTSSQPSKETPKKVLSSEINERKRQFNEVSSSTEIPIKSQNLCLSQFRCKEKNKFSHQPEHFLKQNTFSPASNASLVIIPKETHSGKRESLSRKSNQKTLTWRSPLVFSPNKKFSPQNISYAFHSQGKNKDADPNHLFDDSMQSVISRNNNDFTISYQNSPKKSIFNENPLTKKPRSSQFLLSDKENFELDRKNNDKTEIDSRPAEKNEDLDLRPRKLPNAMDYYSQLSRSHSLDEEKGVIDTNRYNKNIINDERNIYHFKHIQENQTLNSKKIQSTPRSQMTSVDGKEQQQQSIRFNRKHCGNETPRQMNYPINPYCNFNTQFSDGSFKEPNDDECLNKSFHCTQSKFLMSPRNETCLLNSHATYMYPNTRLPTKCCGHDFNTSITCKSVPVLNSVMSSRGLNQLPSNQSCISQRSSQHYNYPIGYNSQQRANASCHQSAKQLFAQSRFNNQIQHSLVSHANPQGFRRLPSEENYKIENNSFLYGEPELNVKKPSQSRLSEEVNVYSTEEDRSSMNQIESNSYSKGASSPMSRQPLNENMVLPTNSVPYGEGYNPLPMKICNCQKCIMRQNMTSIYGMNTIHPYSADYYRNHHAPYFHHPRAEHNTHLLNNSYVSFLGNYNSNMIPSTWYPPAQSSDKEYVMQKFLSSLNQTH